MVKKVTLGRQHVFGKWLGSIRTIWTEKAFETRKLFSNRWVERFLTWDPHAAPLCRLHRGFELSEILCKSFKLWVYCTFLKKEVQDNACILLFPIFLERAHLSSTFTSLHEPSLGLRSFLGRRIFSTKSGKIPSRPGWVHHPTCLRNGHIIEPAFDV